MKNLIVVEELKDKLVKNQCSKCKNAPAQCCYGNHHNTGCIVGDCFEYIDECEKRKFVKVRKVAKKTSENQEYLNKMRKCLELSDSDREKAHIDADNVLCEILIKLGYSDVIDVYNEIGKWYA